MKNITINFGHEKIKVGQKSDSLYIKNYNNKLDTVDRVFYSKKDGNVFECFKDKPMIAINIDELNDLMMHGRQKQISFVKIAEEQVIELKGLIKNLKVPNSYDCKMIMFYNAYNIISDEEFKELKDLFKK